VLGPVLLTGFLGHACRASVTVARSLASARHRGAMFHVKRVGADRPCSGRLRWRPGNRVFTRLGDCPFRGEMGYFWPRLLSPVVAVAITVLPTVG